MSVPTFIDLQGFLVEGQFVVKEFAALKERTVLFHYIFASPIPWHFLASADKSRARWVIRHHHRLRWNDGTIPYSEAKSLITKAVHGTKEDNNDDDDDDDAVIYVKGHEKRKWLRNLLLDDERERAYIETLDADYEDIDSLNNLNADNSIQCGYYYTNCALQNVFKLFNWWADNLK
ncbi:hypothetical protein P5V15_010177 [Pogonomyrmex californicus]